MYKGKLYLKDWGESSKAGAYLDLGFWWGDRQEIEQFRRKLVFLTFSMDEHLATIECRPHFASAKSPWFRVEIEQEMLRHFRGLEGVEVDVQISVTETPVEAKGMYGRYAQALEAGGFFYCPQVWRALGSDDDLLVWTRKQPCIHCGAPAPSQAAHVRRVSDGAGTGIKPEYSVIPLCGYCHHKQHQHGEDTLGGKEAVDKMRMQNLRLWARGKLKYDLGYNSLTEIPPQTIIDWSRDHDLLPYLPKAFTRLTESE